MSWTAIGAFLLALAVAMGAFGAHALRSRLDAYSLSVYEKAVFYHFVHALGILLIGIIARSSGTNGRAGWLLTAGIFLFSGSLYALALSGVRALGAITPLGGLCFIAGWILLGVDSLRSRG